MNAWDREEEQLSQDLENGVITVAEYNQQMSELLRDYRDSAEEAASDAYRRELSNW